MDRVQQKLNKSQELRTILFEIMVLSCKKSILVETEGSK